MRRMLIKKLIIILTAAPLLCMPSNWEHAPFALARHLIVSQRHLPQVEINLHTS